MDEKVLQLRVGIFVMLAFIILLALIYLNSEVWKGQYTVYIKPQTAPGVKANTPVRKNGVLIGRVKSVSTDDNLVTIALGIDNDERIYANEVASIGTESILGDAVIEIMPLPADQRGAALAPSELIATVAIRRNPMEIVDVALNLEEQISNTLESIQNTATTFELTAAQVGEAGEGVAELSQRIQDVFDGEGGEARQLIADFREVSRKTQTALDNFNRIFENINEVIDDPEFKNRFNEFVDSLPTIFDEVRSAITDVRETVTSFQKVSESADRNLTNLEGFTQSLNENGPEILEQVNERLSNVDEIFEQIQGAAQALGNLQNSKGTIGKLLNDPQLYNAVLEAVENIRDQTIKIEPLINDVRLFTDAIARDPGQLGIRGAIKNRRPLSTGYKGSTTGRDRTLRQ